MAGCIPGAREPLLTRPANGLVAAAPEGQAGRALQEAAALYAQASGVEVVVERFAGDAYLKTVSTALLAGSQRFDLVFLPAEDLPRWAAYHALLPLEPPENPAVEPWLAPLTIDGSLYGLPAQPDPLVLWYRADLHEQAGLPHPPRDWATFRANVQALNAPPERYGAAFAAAAGEAGLDYAALLAGFGGQALGGPPDYAVRLEAPAAQRALAFYAGLLADGLALPEADTLTRGDVTRALIEGRAALGFAPLLSVGLLDAPGLAPAFLPSEGEPPAMVGGLSAWAVPRRAPRAEEAQQFAAWLASEEGARAWAQGGGLPAHRDVLGDLPAGSPPVPADLGRALAETQSYQTVLPPVRYNDQMWAALDAAARAAGAGQADPQAALAEAAAELRLALRQGGTIAPVVGEEE